MKRSQRQRLGLILMAGCLWAGAVTAANRDWINAAGGAWETAANWSPAGMPTNTDAIRLLTNATYTVTIDNTTAGTDPGQPAGWMKASSLQIGDGGEDAKLRVNFTTPDKALEVGAITLAGAASSSTGRLEVASGTVTNAGNLIIGDFGVGSLVINGGTFVRTNASSYTYFGNTLAGSRGYLTVSNGLFYHYNNGYGVRMGNANSSYSQVEVAGGTATFDSSSAGSAFVVGYGNGSVTARVVVTGGTLDLGKGSLSTTIGGGNNSDASLVVSNGTFLGYLVYVRNATGANAQWLIAGGTNILTRRFDVYATGRLIMNGGSLVSTNSSDACILAGAGAPGTFVMSNGICRLTGLYVGDGAGTWGQWNIYGGTNSVTNGLNIARQTGSTGAVMMTGGSLEVKSGTLTVGTAGLGSLILSNGILSTKTLYLTAPSALFRMDGGTGTVEGNLTVGYTGSGVRQFVMNGGMLTISNELCLNYGGILGGAIATVSNGILTAGSINVGGDLAGEGVGELYVYGGLVRATNGLYACQRRVWCTGTVVTAQSGILEVQGPVSLGAAGTVNGTGAVARVTIRDGGTLRFVSTVDPAITLGSTNCSLILTNASIEIMASTNASLTNALVSKIGYFGTNTLSLNSATNAWVKNYQFGPSPATNFMHLALSNGGVFRGTNTTFASGSILTIQLGGTTLSQFGRVVDASTLTLGGATLNVTLVAGYTPQSGDSFDILDWVAGPGTFGVKTLPALPGRLKWDDSNLYVNGQIKVRMANPGVLLQVR